MTSLQQREEIDQASVVASVKTHAWQGVRLWKDGGQAIQKSRC